MKRKLLLAGAGQLGSRYLQGMAKYEHPLQIWVCDPSVASLERAAERWTEMGAACEAHELHWISDISESSGEFDIAVLATLPTYDEAIAKLMSVLKEASAGKLVRVIAAIRDQKEQEAA